MAFLGPDSCRGYTLNGIQREKTEIFKLLQKNWTIRKILLISFGEEFFGFQRPGMFPSQRLHLTRCDRIPMTEKSNSAGDRRRRSERGQMSQRRYASSTTLLCLIFYREACNIVIRCRKQGKQSKVPTAAAREKRDMDTLYRHCRELARIIAQNGGRKSRDVIDRWHRHLRSPSHSILLGDNLPTLASSIKLRSFPRFSPIIFVHSRDAHQILLRSNVVIISLRFSSPCCWRKWCNRNLWEDTDEVGYCNYRIMCEYSFEI